MPRRPSSGAGARTTLGRALCAAIACLALAGAGAGCGSQGTRLKVAAASSLAVAFDAYARQLHATRVLYSFAGSDTLAAQIEQGVRPDVYASADPQLAQGLYARGLLGLPVAFASNRLVLAVPAGSSIRSLGDLTRRGVSVALGSTGVPVGRYADQAISHLAPADRRALLANVRDRESDVALIVGRLTEGAVDAGIVYRTDVLAAGRALRAIELPPSLQPPIGYAIGIVRGTARRAAAAAFIQGLLSGAGAADLRAAGFLPPKP